MKIATTPATTTAGRAVTSTGTKLPYYNPAIAAELWSVLASWEEKKYPRTSWPWLELGMKEATLKAKLYNGLRWLQEQGTPHQRHVASRVTFSKIGNSYVLTLRRTPVSLASPQMTAAEPTPDAAETDRMQGDILRNVIKFMAEVQWAGPAAGRRPCYEQVGIHISKEFAQELTDLVLSHGSFAPLVKPGYNGTVRVIALAPGENFPTPTK